VPNLQTDLTIYHPCFHKSDNSLKFNYEIHNIHFAVTIVVCVYVA